MRSNCASSLTLFALETISQTSRRALDLGVLVSGDMIGESQAREVKLPREVREVKLPREEMEPRAVTDAREVNKAELSSHDARRTTKAIGPVKSRSSAAA